MLIAGRSGGVWGRAPVTLACPRHPCGARRRPLTLLGFSVLGGTDREGPRDYSVVSRGEYLPKSLLWDKPEIRIREWEALEGSLEGVGGECEGISCRIRALPLLQVPVEGVLRECEFRLLARKLIWWTQNGCTGRCNHSVALFCQFSGVFGTQNGQMHTSRHSVA